MRSSWQARIVLALLGVVVSVAFADSINPSTLGPALYLAAFRDGGRGVLAFTLGVLAVSTAAGIALVLGPGRLLLAHHPTPHTEHLVELVAGLALVGVAAVLWRARGRLHAHVAEREELVRRHAVLVGAGIMAVELPTALPYFAVIVAVAGSGRPVATQLALIMLFNLVFVAPLFAVFLVRQLAGTRGRSWLERRREAIDRHAGVAVAIVVLVIALILVAVGSTGLARG